MPEPFSEKLAFVLKALSKSRARMAADLGMNKSVIGRWVAGSVKPSAHNLSRLSALVARSVPGFRALDWERDMEGLATLFEATSGRVPAGPVSGLPGGLPLPFLGQMVSMTAVWGAGYEGFYRSTRPFAARPGRFVHDHCMVKRAENGLLRLNLANSGVLVDGWVLPLQEQIFIIGAEFTGGGLVFALLNGVKGAQVDVLDGIILSPILDLERTPTASAIILERIENLTGDDAADEARFADLGAREALAPEGSIPETLREHLARNIGPDPLAMGGDWLLRMPLSRSVSRGAPPSTRE